MFCKCVRCNSIVYGLLSILASLSSGLLSILTLSSSSLLSGALPDHSSHSSTTNSPAIQPSNHSLLCQPNTQRTILKRPFSMIRAMSCSGSLTYFTFNGIETHCDDWGVWVQAIIPVLEHDNSLDPQIPRNVCDLSQADTSMDSRRPRHSHQTEDS